MSKLWPCRSDFTVRVFMILLFISISMFSSIAISCDCPVSAESKKSEKRNEVLYLKSKTYNLGVIETYIAKDAIFMKFSKAVSLVASAPQWTVFFYNTESGKGLSMPMEQWIKHDPKWSFNIDCDWVAHQQLIEIGKGRVFGRPCTRYAFARPDSRGRLAIKNNGNGGEVLVDNDKTVPLQACHIYQCVVRAPQTDGLPLDLTNVAKAQKVEGYSRGFGGTSHLVKTLDLTYKPYSRAMFVHPLKFKPVKYEKEILFEKDNEQNVDEFLKTFQ